MHDSWDNNKCHRHCYYMPVWLNTDLQWVSHQTMQLALKAGKPWDTNFLSHTLSSHCFTRQTTKMYNLIGPARPWHYPLQCYTTLGVFNAFSTLVKLIFHQVTYMTTIFPKCAWFILGVPRWWCHYLVFNLMVTTFKSAKFSSTVHRLSTVQPNR